ncbi:MAG: hypothetical protein H6832_07100 [Planctomycetes bacterium]|nr:hypothetical protein [Planctomycetota bacterium]MCB9890337.1 hypothetical protein [Planctomycetota bacterium]MCB9918155.1 hypothetical protein [Planctomycetota bacterium]
MTGVDGRKSAIDFALQSILHDIKNELTVGLGHLEFETESTHASGVRTCLLRIDRAVGLLQSYVHGGLELPTTFVLSELLLQVRGRIERLDPSSPVLEDLARLADLHPVVAVSAPRGAVYDLLARLLASPRTTLRLRAITARSGPRDVCSDGDRDRACLELRFEETAPMPNYESAIQRERLAICAAGGTIRRDRADLHVELPSATR